MDARTKIEEGKPLIFDKFRGKWVAHTPEEGVRQWFCDYLMEQKGYPKTSISNESPLNLNGSVRRCDTVAYKNGKPAVLIEFKAPDVEIDRGVLLQAVSYNTKLQAPYIILTNSKKIVCIELDLKKGRHSYLNSVPEFGMLKV